MRKRDEGMRWKTPASEKERSARRAAGGEDTRRRQDIARQKGSKAVRLNWLSRKRPVLRFVLVFLLCMGLYYALAATSTMKNRVFPAYLRLNATACSVILRCLGEAAIVNGETVVSPRFSITIAEGCDAIEPSALFVSAVLALPAASWRRLLGMTAGVILLMIINQVRAITMFYVGIHLPKAFDVMHFDIWQAMFVFLAVVLWVIWAIWAHSHSRPDSEKRLQYGTA